jgi:hypothetical protein
VLSKVQVEAFVSSFRKALNRANEKSHGTPDSASLIVARVRSTSVIMGASMGGEIETIAALDYPMVLDQ